METEELASRLEACLPGVSGQGRALLGQYGTVARHSRERAVTWQGDKVTHVYLVLEGRARVLKHRADGSSFILGNLEGGGWIGLPEAVAGVPLLADGLAEAGSAFLSVGAPSFLKICQNLEMGIYLQKELALGACRLHGQFEDRTPLEKIKKFLTLRGGADLKKSPTPGPAVIEITQEQLAEVVGFTRETVNRTLKELEDAAVLRLERGKISVDLARLANI